jgi:hypothetical protein
MCSPGDSSIGVVSTPARAKIVFASITACGPTPVAIFFPLRSESFLYGAPFATMTSSSTDFSLLRFAARILKKSGCAISASASCVEPVPVAVAWMRPASSASVTFT